MQQQVREAKRAAGARIVEMKKEMWDRRSQQAQQVAALDAERARSEAKVKRAERSAAIEHEYAEAKRLQALGIDSELQEAQQQRGRAAREEARQRSLLVADIQIFRREAEVKEAAHAHQVAALEAQHERSMSSLQSELQESGKDVCALRKQLKSEVQYAERRLRAAKRKAVADANEEKEELRTELQALKRQLRLAKQAASYHRQASRKAKKGFQGALSQYKEESLHARLGAMAASTAASDDGASLKPQSELERVDPSTAPIPGPLHVRNPDGSLSVGCKSFIVAALQKVKASRIPGLLKDFVAAFGLEVDCAKLPSGKAVQNVQKSLAVMTRAHVAEVFWELRDSLPEGYTWACSLNQDDSKQGNARQRSFHGTSLQIKIVDPTGKVATEQDLAVGFEEVVGATAAAVLNANMTALSRLRDCSMTPEAQKEETEVRDKALVYLKHATTVNSDSASVAASASVRIVKAIKGAGGIVLGIVFCDQHGCQNFSKILFVAVDQFYVYFGPAAKLLKEAMDCFEEVNQGGHSETEDRDGAVAEGGEEGGEEDGSKGADWTGKECHDGGMMDGAAVAGVAERGERNERDGSKSAEEGSNTVSRAAVEDGIVMDAAEASNGVGTASATTHVEGGASSKGEPRSRTRRQTRRPARFVEASQLPTYGVGDQVEVLFGTKAWAGTVTLKRASSIEVHFDEDNETVTIRSYQFNKIIAHTPAAITEGAATNSPSAPQQRQPGGANGTVEPDEHLLTLEAEPHESFEILRDGVQTDSDELQAAPGHPGPAGENSSSSGAGARADNDPESDDGTQTSTANYVFELWKLFCDTSMKPYCQRPHYRGWLDNCANNATTPAQAAHFQGLLRMHGSVPKQIGSRFLQQQRTLVICVCLQDSFVEYLQWKSGTLTAGEMAANRLFQACLRTLPAATVASPGKPCRCCAPRPSDQPSFLSNGPRQNCLRSGKQLARYPWHAGGGEQSRSANHPAAAQGDWIPV